MRKSEAIKQSEAAGYTIRYFETPTEMRFRKPGSAMDAMNQPDEYMLAQRKSGRWFVEKVTPPRII